MRLMDEVIELGQRGIALLCVESQRPPYAGMRLRDARGNVHAVARVSEQGGLYTLYLPEGDAGYFGRLFRDVRVDATRFEEDDGCPSA